MTVYSIHNHQISGDPLNPDSGDLIAQVGTLEVGKPVPDGWRVLTGNERASQVARVAMRYEIDSRLEALEHAADMLAQVAARIDDNSGSPSFLAEEYDEIAEALKAADREPGA